jgi:phosphoribosylformimino-5-aminoimidazole carboxamide ribonucleotide (ProFAR) isomerase
MPWALTLLVRGALFDESLSRISHFECVVGSLAHHKVQRVEELGKEFGVEVIWVSIRSARER